MKKMVAILVSVTMLLSAVGRWRSALRQTVATA